MKSPLWVETWLVEDHHRPVYGTALPSTPHMDVSSIRMLRDSAALLRCRRDRIEGMCWTEWMHLLKGVAKCRVVPWWSAMQRTREGAHMKKADENNTARETVRMHFIALQCNPCNESVQWIKLTTLHYTTPHHTTSPLTTPHHVTSHHTTLHHTTWWPLQLR